MGSCPPHSFPDPVPMHPVQGPTGVRHSAVLTARSQLLMSLFLQPLHSENPRMQGTGHLSPGASMWPPAHLVVSCCSAWFSSTSLPWSFCSSSWEARPGLCLPRSSQPLSRRSNLNHTLVTHCPGSQSHPSGPPGMTIP